MIADLLRMTVSDPRAAMAALLRLGVARGTALQLLLLGAVLSAMTTWLALVVQPFPDAAVTALVLGNPAVFAVSSVLVALLLAFSLFRVGVALGGLGDLTGAMLLTGWLQVMMVVLQLAEIVVVLALPGVVAALASVAALGLVIWIAVNMTAVLHRFAGVGAAVATLVGAFVLTMVGLVVFAMVLAGLAGGGANV
jgi:hypothetical protein